MFGLRVMIADPDSSFRTYIKDKLIQAGHIVVAETSEGRSTLQQTFNIQPDIILINARMPGKDGVKVSRIIEEQRIAPVILIADYDDYDILAEVMDLWIFGYLVKPVDIATLLPTLELAVANFRRLSGLEEENKKLKHNLETRKIIERAKGILTQAKGYSEEEAFRFLQKISMDKCLPMKKVALKVISTYNKTGKEDKRRAKGDDL